MKEFVNKSIVIIIFIATMNYIEERSVIKTFMENVLKLLHVMKLKVLQ